MLLKNHRKKTAIICAEIAQNVRFLLKFKVWPSLSAVEICRVRWFTLFTDAAISTERILTPKVRLLHVKYPIIARFAVYIRY